MQILLAEKNENIAILYKQVLENRKHKITITSNGFDCLKEFHNMYHEMRFGKLSSSVSSSSPSSAIHHKYKASQSAFGVVLLGYRMPRINGLEVAKEILAVDPHQRIVFTSASPALKKSLKQLHQVVELLQKPFTIKELVDIIEDKEYYRKLEQHTLYADTKQRKSIRFLPSRLLQGSKTADNIPQR
jgi:CheY-like chemotaxis protein